jgi:hypothetical protein
MVVLRSKNEIDGVERAGDLLPARWSCCVLTRLERKVA